jgi:hypothetical protein
MNDEIALKYKHLTAADWGPVSSNYLSEGRRAEEWLIDTMEFSNNHLILATVSMKNIFAPSDNAHQFHLPAYAAMEFVSQVQIIYMHLWSGCDKKTQEVWMLESRFKAESPILDKESIQIEMNVEKIKCLQNKIYCTAQHRVFDSRGGLFNIWIKAWMPQASC